MVLGQTKGPSSPVSCIPVVGALEGQKGKAVGNSDLKSKVGPSPRYISRRLGFSKFFSWTTGFDSSSWTCPLRVCFIQFNV